VIIKQSTGLQLLWASSVFSPVSCVVNAASNFGGYGRLSLLTDQEVKLGTQLLDTRFYPFENNCQRHGIRRLVCHQHVLKNKEILLRHWSSRRIPPSAGEHSWTPLRLRLINSSKYFCRNMNNFHLAHVSKKISKKIHVMVSNTIDAGVKKKSKNEPKATKHSPEKLKNLLGEAQKEKISNGEGRSAGGQVAAINATIYLEPDRGWSPGEPLCLAPMKALELRPSQALTPSPGSCRCPRAPGVGLRDPGGTECQFILYCDFSLHTVLFFLQTNISELVKSLMFSVGHRMHANGLIILHPAGCSMRLLIRRSIDIKRPSLSILEVPRDIESIYTQIPICLYVGRPSLLDKDKNIITRFGQLLQIMQWHSEF
jgi:hypothetical protein